VTEEGLSTHAPCPEIKQLIATFRSICRDGSVAEGLAALYAYESQIPEISQSKMDGLKALYGVTDPKGLSYFKVHITADVEHSRVERELLARHHDRDVTPAVSQVLDRLWGFLSGMCTRHHIACA
jgi:pyrroloquinoline-quinone synthase